jgi:hypothetical protein
MAVICEFDDCKKQPTYGILGSKKAKFCKDHADLTKYIDIKHKTCKDPNCSKRPSYGKLETGIPEYCKIHAADQEGYVDVTHKRCKEKDCLIRPTFGKLGQKAEYCVKHIDGKVGYVDVVSILCKEVNCSKQARFGKINSKKSEYCATHAANKEGYVDIKSNMCIHEEKGKRCTIRAHYGIPGYQPEYCTTHKKDKMIQHSAKYKDGFITCEICDGKIHYTENYCSGCKLYLVEEKTVKRKNKELAIKNLLNEHKIEFTHDLTVKGGCSKKRPDFIINVEWGTIILEVDEFQHNKKSYPCECEISRMKQLYFDVGVNNLLFVRYNPDPYIVIPGQKEYKSLARQNYLIKYLKNLTKHINLGVVYLFYDGFLNPEIENIDPYTQT